MWTGIKRTDSIDELVQDRHLKILGGPRNKQLQVGLTDGTDGVNVRRTAVVLCEV